MKMNQSNILNKYIEKHQEMFEIALHEIEQGRKKSHWMWYIFPQVKELGYSEISKYYAIQTKKEAKLYYQHPYLYEHLMKMCQALLNVKTNDPIQIFGSIDAMKLQSSLTLFYLIDQENDTIKKTLQKFYAGKIDEKTVDIFQRME